jgi:ATP-binding cassette subfamily E protein 1
LSGGELQRVALALCLGKPAPVYLIDEPSAYLDSEQRIVAAKIIKRYILHSKTTAFIVEHDFIMVSAFVLRLGCSSSLLAASPQASYLADRVIVFSGEPGVEATAETPTSLLSGMNAFLKVGRLTSQPVLIYNIARLSCSN